MLDINLFREKRGGNPEIIRESQRRRFKNVDLVDQVIQLDEDWRQRKFELDHRRKDLNSINKRVAQLRIVSVSSLYLYLRFFFDYILISVGLYCLLLVENLKLSNVLKSSI